MHRRQRPCAVCSHGQRADSVTALPERSRLPQHRSIAALPLTKALPLPQPGAGTPDTAPAPCVPPAGAPPARFQNHPRARHRPAGQWRPRARRHVEGANQSRGVRGAAASLPLSGTGPGVVRRRSGAEGADRKSVV